MAAKEHLTRAGSMMEWSQKKWKLRQRQRENRPASMKEENFSESENLRWFGHVHMTQNTESGCPLACL